MLFLLIVSGWFYLAIFAKLGWCPDDVGVMGQQAIRFMNGEWPHRDYHETYTGLLTAMNALVFKFFGVDILFLHYMSIMFCLLSLCCVCLFLINAGNKTLSLVVGLMTLVWAFPNYISSLPSWYVVSFWCLGAFFLDRYRIDSRYKNKGWMMVLLLGGCAGFATLMKVPGVLLVGGCLLAICHMALSRAEVNKSTGDGVKWGSWLIGFVLSLHLGSVIFLLCKSPTLGSILNLFAPNFFLNAYLWLLLFKINFKKTIDVRCLWMDFLWISIGFILVVTPPLIFFLTRGEFRDLWAVLFTRLSASIISVTSPFPHFQMTLWSIPWILILMAGLWGWGKRHDRSIAWIVGGISLMFFVFDRGQSVWYVVTSVRLALPLFVLCVLYYLHRVGDEGREEKNIELFLPISLLVTCGYIQFPSAYVTYFFYLCPLLWITVGRWVGSDEWKLPKTGGVIGIALILFGVISLNPSKFSGVPYEPLDLPNASLVVPSVEKRIWFPLVKRIQSLSPAENSPIFAGPDCPEVYFLSNRRNPTKILYEVFENQANLEHDILGAIDKERCSLVVVNLRPNWSRPFDYNFHRLLADRFDRVERYGHFLLYWMRK